MADDNLFEEPQAPPDKSVQPKPTSDGGPSLEAIQEKLDQISDGTSSTKELQDQVAMLTHQLQQMQAQAQQAAALQQRQQEQQVTPDEKFQELYQNPEGFINQRARQAALQTMQQLGPHLKLQAEQTRDLLVSQQRENMDKEYGEGTWDELFDKGFKNVLENMSLEMQSSREHVDSAVSAILGQMVRNPETLHKLEERRAEVKKRASAPSMMSGVRPTPRGGGLNEEEKEFLASLERSGMPMDPKEYIQFRDIGNTESDWAKLKENAGAS